MFLIRKNREIIYFPGFEPGLRLGLCPNRARLDPSHSRPGFFGPSPKPDLARYLNGSKYGRNNFKLKNSKKIPLSLLLLEG